MHGNDQGDQFGPWMLVEHKPQQRPMMVAKATFVNIDAGARGSRLGILSDSHMEVEGVKPAALNGNNRNQGSYEEILGKDLLAREKLLFNPKTKTK
ncbi:hypothetical protein Goari_004467, partial [Gossypium aridum]|nr:hypothetical protein [Gossypium aridum]